MKPNDLACGLVLTVAFVALVVLLNVALGTV